MMSEVIDLNSSFIPKFFAKSLSHLRKYEKSLFVESKINYPNIQISKKIEKHFKLNNEQIKKVIITGDWLPFIVIDILDDIAFELRSVCDRGNILIFDSKYVDQNFWREQQLLHQYINMLTIVDPYQGIVFSLAHKSITNFGEDIEFSVIINYGYVKDDRVIPNLPNCRNCGAVHKKRICEYCGTVVGV